MITKLDIIRSAWQLIKYHGDDAEIEAALKADRFLAQGNLDGYALWQGILRTIVTLRRQKPTHGEVMH